MHTQFGSSRAGAVALLRVVVVARTTGCVYCTDPRYWYQSLVPTSRAREHQQHQRHQRPALSTSDLPFTTGRAPASQRHDSQRQQHRLQRAGNCGHRRALWSGPALATSAAGG